MENIQKSITAIKGIFKDAGTKEHFHKDYSIGIIWSGNHSFIRGSKSYSAKYSDVRIFAPYELHKSLPGSWGYTQIFIPKSTLLHYASTIHDKELNTLSFKAVAKNQDALYSSYLLYNSLQTKDILEIEESFRIFLKSILQQTTLNLTEPKILYSNKDILRAIDYIEANLDNSKLTIEQIAKELNLSPFYFARSFKKIFNIAPHSYIQSLRVERARELLKKDIPNSIVAQMSGFSDQSHMIREFKKYLGFRPSQILF